MSDRSLPNPDGAGRPRSVPLIATFGVLTALFSAGYGVMFTALDDFRDQYGISGGKLGMVVAAGFFSSFAAQVLLAPLADRGHARRLVYLGMGFEVAGLLAMALGRSLFPLLAARFVMGIGAGMAQPAIRRIIIVADPDHLGQNLGRLLAADVGGFALGPAISAVLIGPFGIPTPFLVIAVVTAACFPLIVKVKVHETEVGEEGATRFAFDLLRMRPYVATLLMGVAVFLMIGTFDSLWSLVLDDLKASDFISNLGITIFALPLMIFGSAGGRLAQRFGPFRLATIGLTFGGVFMFSYGRLPTGLAMLAVGVVHAFNDGFTVSATGVAVGLVVPADRQAGAQGLLGGAQTLAGGLTAMAAGALYQSSGRAVAYTACALTMFACVIGGSLLAGPSWRMKDASVARSTTREVAVG